MATHPCPICSRPVNVEQTLAPPFCSRRCREIDLARWLDERHGLHYEAEEGRLGGPTRADRGDVPEGG